VAAIIIVLDVFVGIIAVLGLIAGWTQLRARLRTPGAQGVVLAIDRLTPRRKNIARLQVNLRMVGPAVRYEVALDTESDGNRFEVSTPKPETRPSMGCDDDELSWTFETPEDNLDSVWVIASWIDDHTPHLRMAAIASNLSTLELYEWRWAADWRLSKAGHWRRRRGATIPPRTIPGMGPLELGRAPGPKRPTKIAAEAVPEAGD
jgi:hypothetical protein